MRKIEDLKKSVIENKIKSKNIGIIGTSKQCGVTSLTQFLYKNYGITPELNPKQINPLSQLESSQFTLLLDNDNIINIDTPSPNQNGLQNYLDKEGLIIVIDVSEKNNINVDKLTQILIDIQRFRLNVIWFINKLDKAIFDMNLSNTEAIYQILVDKIDQINTIIENINANSEEQKEQNQSNTLSFIDELNPQKGNVLFGSAIDGWAFSLDLFAHQYSHTFKIEPSKLITKFWGENFYDHQTKTWSINAVDEKNIQNRSFCQFVFDPIWRMYNLVRQGSLVAVEEFVKKLGIQVDITNKSGRILLRMVMYAWLNSAKGICETVEKYIKTYQEGIIELSRWDIFSYHLDQIKENKQINIIYCFGIDENTQLRYGKVLKKSKEEQEQQENKLILNVFESDLLNGTKLISKDIEIKQIYHQYFVGNNIPLQLQQIHEGQVILFQADNIQIGQILTNLDDIPFYKQYHNNIINSNLEKKKTQSSIVTKNPFSIDNNLLGTIDKLDNKISKIIKERNELFHNPKELYDILMNQFEFTQKDIDSILTICNDSIVFNYTKQKLTHEIKSSFDHAIISSQIISARINLESIKNIQNINHLSLTQSLIDEFLNYTI